LDVGSPENVVFDTSYVLQAYIFGDGSGNMIRFCLDDRLPAVAAENHEVSVWFTIDWIGWKLIEWDLSNPDLVGSWLGDGNLDGNLRFDSIQLTHSEGTSPKGKLYFDDLRVVKKYNILKIEDATHKIPEDFSLSQNYPNPFNPATQIRFTIAEPNPTTLTVYDVVGRKIITLVNEKLAPGEYEVMFEAGSLSSGTYFYVLHSGSQSLRKKMVLLK
jgi:hypothetical protein